MNIRMIQALKYNVSGSELQLNRASSGQFDQIYKVLQN